MFILVIASSLLFRNVLGVPKLNSSIGLDLSGEICPGPITFICNAPNFGTNGFIAWYINDTQLARYLFNQSISVNSLILSASVQAPRSSFVDDNFFSFENFTLTVNVTDLLPFQGQNISCGTTDERSKISINKFTIPAQTVQDISYQAKYQGVEGELVGINVQWIDAFHFAGCKGSTFYNVQLLSNQGVISKRALSTEDCTSSQCTIQFNSSDLDKSIESYKIIVTASNTQIENNFTSSVIVRNSTDNFIRLNTCNNTALITCPASVNRNCSMNSPDSVNLMPDETFLLSLPDTTPQDIKIVIHINSTIIIQTINYDSRSDDETRVILAFGVIIYIIGSLLLIFSFVVALIYYCKNQNRRDGYYYIWMATLLFSVILVIIFIISLVLWIVAGTSLPDSCLNYKTSPDPVLTAALVLSILLLLLAPITLGGFLIVLIKCEREHKSNDEEKFIPYKVKFGSKADKVPEAVDVVKCTICSEVFSSTNKDEEGKVVFNPAKGKQHICNICCKGMCGKCFKIVYLKYCKEEKDICNDCYADYQAEKKKLPRSSQCIGKIKPQQADYSKCCKECGLEEGQTGTKWGTTEVYTANISACSTCGQRVCNECFDEHEVEIEYLQEKRQVCKNCYAIYKMTSLDNSTNL